MQIHDCTATTIIVSKMCTHGAVIQSRAGTAFACTYDAFACRITRDLWPRYRDVISRSTGNCPAGNCIQSLLLSVGVVIRFGVIPFGVTCSCGVRTQAFCATGRAAVAQCSDKISVRDLQSLQSLPNTVVIQLYNRNEIAFLVRKFTQTS